MKLFGAMKIEDNELTIGGIGAKKLAEDYGTPLYIMDENLIRKIVGTIIKALNAMKVVTKLLMQEKHVWLYQFVKSLQRKVYI